MTDKLLLSRWWLVTTYLCIWVRFFFHKFKFSVILLKFRFLMKIAKVLWNCKFSHFSGTIMEILFETPSLVNIWRKVSCAWMKKINEHKYSENFLNINNDNRNMKWQPTKIISTLKAVTVTRKLTKIYTTIWLSTRLSERLSLWSWHLQTS